APEPFDRTVSVNARFRSRTDGQPASRLTGRATINAALRHDLRRLGWFAWLQSTTRTGRRDLKALPLSGFCALRKSPGHGCGFLQSNFKVYRGRIR
ncbi:MAG: hypothetical protein KGR68_08585, partial [Betaproteobacteria bacterium]|nr:hypothetical protein [Betaproteobacteria bacterium]